MRNLKKLGLNNNDKIICVHECVRQKKGEEKMRRKKGKDITIVSTIINRRGNMYKKQ